MTYTNRFLMVLLSISVVLTILSENDFMIYLMMLLLLIGAFQILSFLYTLFHWRGLRLKIKYLISGYFVAVILNFLLLFWNSENTPSIVLITVMPKRRLTGALYFSPNPKFKQIAEACPTCRYPLGSGGKRKRRSFAS